MSMEAQELTEELDFSDPIILIEGLEDLIGSNKTCDIKKIRSEWDLDGYYGRNGEGKNLPYWNHDSLTRMQRAGFKLYRDANVQTAIESLVSYVVHKGWGYKVSVKSGQDYLENKLRKYQEAHANLISEVSLGNSQGWYFVLDESYRRWLRDGEYFRRWWVIDGILQVRFIEVEEIHQPPNWRNVTNQEEVPANVAARVTKEGVCPGELGIVSAPNDAANEIGYWHCTSNDGDIREHTYEYLSSDKVQHAKQGVDSNDPRGIPAFLDVACQCVSVEAVSEAMNQLAVKQSKYAVIHKHKATNRREAIRALAEHRRKELNHQVSSNERDTTETHLKNVDVEMGGMKVQTRNYIGVIQQGQRFIGGVRQVPEYMISNSANTGNRSSLQAAASPFGRRVSREQKAMWWHDLELQRKALQVILGYKESTAQTVSRKLAIHVSFPLTETKDPHKDAQTVIALREDKAISRQEQRRKLDIDHELMTQELEEEGGYEDLEGKLQQAANAPSGEQQTMRPASTDA